MSDLIELKLATVKEAEELQGLQVKAFLPLYQKYRDDDTNPAKESLERVTWKIADENSNFYFILYAGEKVGGVRVRWHQGNVVHENIKWISPIFIVPEWQNSGIAGKVIEKLFHIYPNVIEWRLDTIKQEEGNCHLYEKCGFIRVGAETVVDENMTLIDYVKNCVDVRRFEEKDANEVRNLIVRNFLEVNSKDYGIGAMEELAKVYDVKKVLSIAEFAHMYVFEWKNKIVGVGSISSFWGSETVFTAWDGEKLVGLINVIDDSELTAYVHYLCVDPEYQGRCIGKELLQRIKEKYKDWNR